MGDVSSDDSSINVVDTDSTSDSSDLNSSDLLGCDKNVTRKRVHRRDYHNALERKRRDNLKGCFTDLRDILPHYRSLKKKGVQNSNNASRVDILSNAADFIDRQTAKNAKLREKLQYLETCIRQSKPVNNNVCRTGKNARLKKKMACVKTHMDQYAHRVLKVKVEPESSTGDVEVEPESLTGDVMLPKDSSVDEWSTMSEADSSDSTISTDSDSPPSHRLLKLKLKVEPESSTGDVEVEPESLTRDVMLPKDSSVDEWSTVSESDGSDGAISTDSDSPPSPPRAGVRRVLSY